MPARSTERPAPKTNENLARLSTRRRNRVSRTALSVKSRIVSKIAHSSRIFPRLTFTQRRGLCYGCFHVRHGAMNCTFKKACGIDGCKLSHHRLLHKGKGSVERTARPHTLRSDRRQIAFKMLRLDARCLRTVCRCLRTRECFDG